MKKWRWLNMSNSVVAIITLAFTSGMMVILSIDNSRLRKEKKNREDEMFNAVDLGERCTEEESVHGNTRVEKALKTIKEAKEEIKLGAREMKEAQDSENEWLEKLNEEYKEISDERKGNLKYAYEVIGKI